MTEIMDLDHVSVYNDNELIRMQTAKNAVAHYLNSTNILSGMWVTPADIYIVWFCKTLQNWKALLSTDVTNIGIYFEVTFNGDKQELYLDHYQKALNVKFVMEPEGLSDATQ